MKVSRDGVIPQFELGPRLGGFKVLYQRTGTVARVITMVSAMIAAYSTTPVLQTLFGSFAAFFSVAVGVLLVYMVIDFTVILPSEQRFLGAQAQRTERSPLKQDTECILERLDQLEQWHEPTTDGGEDHLADLPDGCGCTEVWDHLSERR